MPRRKFTREFKLSAVKLVNEQGYSIPEAAKSLGVDAANVRGWVEKFSSEPRGGCPAAKGRWRPSCVGCARRTRGC